MAGPKKFWWNVYPPALSGSLTRMVFRAISRPSLVDGEVGRKVGEPAAGVLRRLEGRFLTLTKPDVPMLSMGDGLPDREEEPGLEAEPARHGRGKQEPHEPRRG